ncbi:MAG: adenylosuccinate synthase, partial [Lentisphaerae bacterium]
MPSKVLIGLQWGDEGKGKIIDVLTEDTDAVIRFQGGANAGHTIEIGEQKFILHLIPSGIMRPDNICIIGNGMVVDPLELVQEIRGLEERGVEVRNRLRISEQAHLVLPWHRRIDGLQEHLAGKAKIGTTQRGIGPAYTDKFRRRGIRFCDLQDLSALQSKLEAICAEYNEIFQRNGIE